MRQWYELTVPAVLGDDEQDDEKETILNRTLKIADGGLEYSVDPRREQQIRAENNINSGSKGLDAPVEQEELPDRFDEKRDDPRLDVASVRDCCSRELFVTGSRRSAILIEGGLQTNVRPQAQRPGLDDKSSQVFAEASETGSEI